MRFSAMFLVMAACGRLQFDEVVPPPGQDAPPRDDAAIIDTPAGNLAPIPDAGGDQMVTFINGGTPISVNTSGSMDPDGSIADCTLFLDSGSSSSSGGCNTIGTVIYLPGLYPIRLVVTDDQGLSAETTIVITVVSDLGIPDDPTVAVLDAGDSQSVAIGAPTVFDFSASWNSDGANFRSFGMDFGDGTSLSSTALDSDHVYATAGTFTASFILENFTIPFERWPKATVDVTVN
jgi:hypothetical protein